MKDPFLSSFQVPTSLFRAIASWLNRVLLVLYVLFICSVVLDYGFYLDQEFTRTLYLFDGFVIISFMVQQMFKLLITPDRRAFFRARRIEYLLSLVLLASFILTFGGYGFLASLFSTTPPAMFRIIVLMTRMIMLIEIALALMRYNYLLASIRMQPALLFLASFLLVILMGTGALLLPKSTTAGITPVNAIFTSVSAVCVTGLTVVDTGTAFTPLGKIILLTLIQIGGLGLMTVTTFFTLFSGSLSIKEHVLMREFLNQDNLGQIRKTLRHIITFTLLVEAAGALALAFSWWYHPFASERQQVFTAVFHSVSAFCNAGFSTFSQNLAERGSAMNLGVNLTITTLIIIGGIGFLVTRNIGALRPGAKHYRLRSQLTVHTKIVLITTAVLIITGTGFILALDAFHPGTLGSLGFPDKLLASYFHSVSTRTAGFNTIDISQLSVGSSLIMILWMFIGASPGSTGGGVKTTTVAIIVLAVVAVIRGKSRIEFGRRQISAMTVERAFITLSLALVTLGTTTFVLALIEPLPFIDILFECSSALGTVGLSRGITMLLSDASKLTLAATMLVGRVGALTILVAFVRQSPRANYDYPTEHVIIG